MFNVQKLHDWSLEAVQSYMSYHSLFLVQLDYNSSPERNTGVHPEE